MTAEPAQADPHAGHVQASDQQPDPHAGHSLAEPQTQDPHADHAPGQSSNPHAGHAMPSMSQTQAPPVAPPPPAAFSGPEHAGTTIFDQELFLRKRERSEEHTSELQSLMRISYAVFCLKKKKQQTN